MNLNYSIESNNKLISSSIELEMLINFIYLLNPFVPNAPLLYPLKISENLTVFREFTFSGGTEWCIGNKWVKKVYSQLTFTLSK